MFDLIIRHKNGKTETSTFTTMDELNAYNLSVYGPEKSIDENGNEVINWTKEIVDNSAIELAKEQKKLDRKARIESLKTLDLSKVTTIAQLKPIIAQLIKEVLKDEE